MVGDKLPRGEVGRLVAIPAVIQLDVGSTVECIVTEISERGARLSVPNAESIPDTFTLIFVRSATVQRHCTVVSREPGHLSVEMSKAQRPVG